MLFAPGEDLDLGRLEVGREFVEDYLSAVEDGSAMYGELGVAPPMALVSHALGALLKKLAFPPGAIHASQELGCVRAVRLGEEVSCVARLSRIIRRGDWRFMSADFTICGADGKDVLKAKSTVLVPIDEAEGD